jgi:glycosyltransferase involved in cell wall biosynthesis
MRQFIFSNYDAPGNPYYSGGGARAIHEIARELAARHRLTVVTGRFPGSGDENVDGVHYRRLGPAGAGPRLGQLLFQFLLPLAARRFEGDLWVESLTPPFSTACLPWFSRRPVVALTQVLAGEAMSRKYKLPFGAIERWGLKAYRQAVATSEHLRGRLLAANPRLNVRVIPNGVPRELVERPVRKTEEHLLFLGRLDVHQKGLDLLLEAVARLQGEPPLPWVVAGAGTPADEAFVRRRIGELGLGGQVRLAGRVDDAGKEDLLRRAMLLAMPSRFEASPLVAIEAFCFQTPVVLFGIPELAGLPDSACVRAPPFDVGALARTIRELAGDGARRQALGRAGKEFAHRFAWDDLARQYEDFFESILANR